jgi:hypothetical protein
MTEQLDDDLKRQERVRKGKLSQNEADEQAEKWEKVRLRINLCSIFKRND